MRFTGTMRGGVVVFDGKVPIGEGVRVEVEPVAERFETSQPDELPLAVRVVALTPSERSAVLAAAADVMAREYSENDELTAFTALDAEEWDQHAQAG